jgi:hypothetical protein
VEGRIDRGARGHGLLHGARGGPVRVWVPRRPLVSGRGEQNPSTAAPLAILPTDCELRGLNPISSWCWSRIDRGAGETLQKKRPRGWSDGLSSMGCRAVQILYVLLSGRLPFWCAFRDSRVSSAFVAA